MMNKPARTYTQQRLDKTIQPLPRWPQNILQNVLRKSLTTPAEAMLAAESFLRIIDSMATNNLGCLGTLLA
jgi:hypothetical protein